MKVNICMKGFFSYFTYSLCKCQHNFRKSVLLQGFFCGFQTKVLLLAGKTEDKNSSYSSLTVTTKFFFPAVAQIDDSNYIRISFSITQSCLNIIDNYKMVQFFRNSVIGNYSAVLPRQKAVFHQKLFHCVRECLS